MKLFRTLQKVDNEYSDLIIKDAEGNHFVERLILDPFSLLLYTTQPEEYQVIKELQDQGYDIVEAIEKVLEESNVRR